MPAYAVAMVKVNNQEAYQEYARLAGPAVAQHGGRFLARGGIAHTQEGAVPYNRMVIVEFPSVAAAKTFYDSPEYQAARAKRLGAADFNMTFLEGM